MTFDPLNPKASQRPSLGKRLATGLVMGFLLIAAIGFAIWGTRLNAPQSTARAPAPAASESVEVDLEELQTLALDTAAPAARVPAAETANEDNTPPVATSDDDRQFAFKRGETVSGRFGKDAKKFCEHNQIADCNRVQAGVKYQLPEGVEPKKYATKAAKPQVARQAVQTAKLVLPKTNEAGEILYRRVGVAPLKGCGKRDILSVTEEAWTVLGISEEDRAWLRLNIDQKHGPRINLTEAEGLFRIPTGMRLEQVTFCRKGKVVSMGPMRTAWSADEAVYGEKFALPSGKVLVWMRNCFNWVVVDLPPPPKKEEPPVTVTPPAPSVQEVPPAEPPIQEPPPPVTEAPKSKGMCDHIDPAVALGQEYTLPHDNGARDDSTFVTASVYCLRRLPSDDGSHGIGAKITASMWDGLTAHKRGEFSGWNVLFGPSYKQILDKGIDWEVSVVGGKQVEEYREGAYASRREFGLVGLTAGLNDYRRRLNGEEWFPEWQVFGVLTFPLDKDVSHSIFAKPIADTGDLSRFDFGLQAGFRQWIYETPDLWVHPYFQAGVFVQHPTSASMSLRLGIADPDHIFGFGVGHNYDLKNGGDLVPALGWWADPIKGGRVVRDKVRQRQIVSEAAERGVTMDRAKNGFIKSIDIGPPPLK